MHRWCIALVLGFATQAAAATWHVDAANPACPGNGSPGNPFCTIQAAILASAAGDSILVAAGVYLENVDFLGKDVEVIATGGAAVTVIDGNQSGSCVRMVTGEGPGAVLRGFTLTNGSGTVTAYRGQPTVLAGHAVFCEGSSPRILDNNITGNIWKGPFLYHQIGTGIYCKGGSPVIAGNEIDAQHADEGPGVVCWQGAAPRIENNRFHDLELTLAGGGVTLVECGQAAVLANEFRDNGSVAPFGGYTANAGTGVYALDCGSLELRDNVFERNFAEDGGAVYLWRIGVVTVEDCRFESNAAYFGSGGLTAFDCAVLAIRRCTFVSNGSYYSGGALSTKSLTSVAMEVTVEDCGFESNSGNVAVEAVELGASGTQRVLRCKFQNHPSPPLNPVLKGAAGILVEDCLFARNRIGLSTGDSWIIRRCTFADHAWVGVNVEGTGNLMESSIVAFSQIAAIGGVAPIAGLEVRDSLVQGGFPGVNVIDTDPKFVNAALADYRLLSSSPCIDLGRASDPVCGVDVAQRPRRVAGTFAPAARVDMGAHEFSHVDLAASKLASWSFAIDSTGTGGLSTLLFVGLAPGATCLPPAGTLLIDVAKPWLLLPWVPLPSSIQVGVPALPGLPPAIWIQQLAIGPAGGSGNLSAAAVLELP